MSRNTGGDTQTFFIVGALVVVLVAVVAILSGHFPLYGERRPDVQIETPRAELVLPPVPEAASLPCASFA